MTVKKFALADILPNPYQTRQAEDPQHIKDLAESIKDHTMLQMPSARPAADQPGKVQLAFGHSRFAAYKLLHDEGTPGFYEFPVNLVEMDEQQMFEAAVTENRARKDLTPIEEAMAMLVYRDQFKKTSEEIGKLFQLSDSAVRNKIRLLELPDEVKGLVGVSITENAAREIVSAMDLPEGLVARYGPYKTEKEFRKGLIEDAIKGASIEDLHNTVEYFFNSAGEEMDKKPWKHDEELVGKGIIGICKGCAFLQKRGKDFCLKPACFKAKLLVWKRQYLSQASLISGILVHEKAGKNLNYGAYTDFGWGQEAKLGNIKKARCENLRLVYDEINRKPSEREQATHLVADGFPFAKIVCMKRSGHCTCLDAIEKGIKVGAENTPAVAEEQLKEMRRQIHDQQRIDKDEVRKLAEQAIEQILSAMDEESFTTWKYVFLNFRNYSVYNKKEIESGDFQSLIAFVVKQMVDEKISYCANDRRAAISQLNGMLTSCELENLETEPEEVKVEETNGQ